MFRHAALRQAGNDVEGAGRGDGVLDANAVFICAVVGYDMSSSRPLCVNEELAAQEPAMLSARVASPTDDAGKHRRWPR